MFSIHTTERPTSWAHFFFGQVGWSKSGVSLKLARWCSFGFQKPTPEGKLVKRNVCHTTEVWRLGHTTSQTTRKSRDRCSRTQGAPSAWCPFFVSHNRKTQKDVPPQQKSQVLPHPKSKKRTEPGIPPPPPQAKPRVRNTPLVERRRQQKTRIVSGPSPRSLPKSGRTWCR